MQFTMIFFPFFVLNFMSLFFKTLKALFSLLYDWTPIPKCLGVVITFHEAKAEHFSMVWQCSRFELTVYEVTKYSP